MTTLQNVFNRNILMGGSQGSDVTLLNKMNQQHRGNSCYIASKSSYDTGFGICHFAGVVYYDSNGTQINSDLLEF